MKTTLLNIALLMLLAGVTSAKAQSVPALGSTEYASTDNAAQLSAVNELMRIGYISRNSENNSSVIKIWSKYPQDMKVKFFKMNGDMAKEDTYALKEGVNELTIIEDRLTTEVYIVQFYTADGSALRKFVKAY